MIQIRAHGRDIPAHVTIEDGALVARVVEPIRGVAAGQAMVVYQGTRVLGQGSITETTCVGQNVAPLLPTFASRSPRAGPSVSRGCWR